MGLPEYSYYFVLKEFIPALRELGEVVIVETPESEVDEIYFKCLENQERCVFLAFAPPHKVQAALHCPTIVIFAWEFDSLPNESWLNDPQQDWGVVLSQMNKAITHSNFTVQAVHDLMGPKYPVTSIPAPVWDNFEDIRRMTLQETSPEKRTITIDKGVIIDSNQLNLSDFLDADPDKVHRETYGRLGISPLQLGNLPDDQSNEAVAQRKMPVRHNETVLRITVRYLIEWYKLVLHSVLPKKLQKSISFTSKLIQKRLPRNKPASLENSSPTMPAETASKLDPLAPTFCSIELNGVVFTTVFNPYDGRKNWQDMLTAFCIALQDKPDATLIFKLTHCEYHSAVTAMLKCMAQLPPFDCRIVIMQGYLSDEDYKSLMLSTSFVVNASYGEGQCIPLMEFLSCGKPAIAPSHSGMSDYIDEKIAFVVKSWWDASAWPHDPRLACRTRRRQIDWESISAAFEDAYLLYKTKPKQYQEMSQHAIARMQQHCSRATTINKLRPVLFDQTMKV